MALASAGFVLVDRVGPMLFVLRAAQGLAFAAGFNAAATLAIELAPPARRAAALGLFGVSTLATHALAPTLGEQIVHAAGFATLFAVAAAFSLVGLGVAWALPEPALHPSAGGTRFRPNSELAFAIATVACCGAAFGSVITFVPTFVRDANLGPVSTFFLCYTATAILTRIGAGDLGDTLGRRAVIRPALALLATSIAALAWVRSTLALAAAGLLFGAAQGLVYPTLNAFTVDQAEEGQLGRTQSLYNGAFNLGVTLGAFAFGPVVHVFGHRRMFLCAAAVAGVALAIFSVGTRQAARATR
jgi:predicted MFS family arabinose efflux permease